MNTGQFGSPDEEQKTSIGQDQITYQSQQLQQAFYQQQQLEQANSQPESRTHMHDRSMQG